MRESVTYLAVFMLGSGRFTPPKVTKIKQCSSHNVHAYTAYVTSPTFLLSPCGEYYKKASRPLPLWHCGCLASNGMIVIAYDSMFDSIQHCHAIIEIPKTLTQSTFRCLCTCTGWRHPTRWNSNQELTAGGEVLTSNRRGVKLKPSHREYEL